MVEENHRILEELFEGVKGIGEEAEGQQEEEKMKKD